MTQYIKLKNAGESITLKVHSCAKATTGNFPGLLFSGMTATGEVTLEVPVSSAERQLKRLELTADQIIGETITISRDPNAQNPAKPFWGISIARPGDVKPKPASVRLQPGEEFAEHGEDFPHVETGAPPSETKSAASTNAITKTEGPLVTAAAKRAELEAAYLALYDRVAIHLANLGAPREVAIATAQPIAATVFINWKDRGLLA